MFKLKVLALSVAIAGFCVNGYGQFISEGSSTQNSSLIVEQPAAQPSVVSQQYPVQPVASQPAVSQPKPEPLTFEERSSWHVGVELGPRFSFTKFTNLDNSLFGQVPTQNSFVWGLFLKKDFARHFSIRPEILFLKRNTRVEFNPSVLPENYSVNYGLNASYFDVRLPLMFEFNRRWVCCPYIYLAPVFGVVTGGDINLSLSSPVGVQTEGVELNKSNINPVYFAAMAAAGLSFNIKNLVNIGVELGYEYGITDTYSKNEKEGRSVVKDNLCFPAYNVQGKRMFSGLELKFSLSVPFSTFKKRKPAPAPAPVPVVYAPVVETPVKEVPVEQPALPYFMSLDEANRAVNEGRDISGAVISDPEAITFENNSSKLSKESYSYLDLIVDFLNNTKHKIVIQGHTDNVGDEASNMVLSERRAKSVYTYIISKGVDPQTVSYSFYGESCPVADNNTPEGRALNRRVEFKIQ